MSHVPDILKTLLSSSLSVITLYLIDKKTKLLEKIEFLLLFFIFLTLGIPFILYHNPGMVVDRYLKLGFLIGFFSYLFSNKLR